LNAHDYIDFILLVIGGIFTVLWWLLRDKDAKQGKEISMLFDMHNKDAEKLTSLELKIAGEHYPSKVIDQKLDKIEGTLKDGFKEMRVYLGEMLNARGDQTGSYKFIERRSKPHRDEE